jgi:hypothetical protein
MLVSTLFDKVWILVSPLEFPLSRTGREGREQRARKTGFEFRHLQRNNSVPALFSEFLVCGCAKFFERQMTANRSWLLFHA